MKKISVLIFFVLTVSLCITQPPEQTSDIGVAQLLSNQSNTHNSSIGSFGIYTSPQLYKYLPKLGASWTFVGVFWEDIEPEQDVFTFEKSDAVVQEAQRNQVNLIVKIRTGTCWATKEKSSTLKTSSPPESLEDYAQFVSTLVDRYKDSVTYWAVENEMNTSRFWEGTLEDYNQVLETAYTTIKNTDPSAQVLDSGLASMTYGTCIAREMYQKGQHQDALHFFNQYYRQRELAVSSQEELEKILYSQEAERVYTIMMDHFANPHYDVYQLHYYEDYSTVDEVLTYIRDHLFKEREIFAVEMGYAFRDDEQYSEKEHAADIVKLMVTLLAHDVPVQIYLPLIDLTDDDTEEWRGLVSPPPQKQKRPALTSYLITTHLLNARDFTGNTEKGFWYEFENVTVVWSEQEKEQSISSRKAIIVDIEGTKTLLDENTPVKIGPDPLFIIQQSLPESENAEIITVQFPSYDGELVEGFVRKPTGASKYPAVILVHGGVSSQEAAVSMAKNIGSLFVDRGYVVLAVHYRNGPIGLQDVEDTLASIEFVKTLDYVDPERIGVYGSSHGGYIALMCAWKSDVKAVVEAAGFCDLGKMAHQLLTRKGEWHQMMIDFYGGYPDENPEMYREYSPCEHVSQFTAPVFVIHGKMDITVAVEHAYTLKDLLDYHKKPYQIYISETGEHGFYHRRSQETQNVWTLIFEFFDQYLK